MTPERSSPARLPNVRGRRRRRMNSRIVGGTVGLTRSARGALLRPDTTLLQPVHWRIDMQTPTESQPSQSPSVGGAQVTEAHGSSQVCVLLGILSVLAGLYNLLVDPSADAGSFVTASANIISLQKMFMGATFTICGSIFLAAALRPRR